MKLVFSSRRVVTLDELIKESDLLKTNPDVNFYIAPDGAEVTAYKYSNGLWKKEIVKNSRRIVRFSAKIGGKIVMTEHAEMILDSRIFESVAVEVAEMFSQYSNSKLWVK
jgi:D-serine dehydratase